MIFRGAHLKSVRFTIKTLYEFNDNGYPMRRKFILIDIPRERNKDRKRETEPPELR